ncbi:DUF6547 family protein [Methylomonas sp. ZR1]|uniref:DUF6547 family protein n=1 Tax=Methylomonas sp. ZR1 TaxID=1797072 RepID=UPI001492BDCE|nr:DUF6547 family protein [Methylomonas sp. ZR1]
MSRISKPRVYRQIIDELVRECQQGQGQIGSNRARTGLWNQNATEESIPEQHAINVLLVKLTKEDREVLAHMLAYEFEIGVFETLKALERFGVEPFNGGYEGSPYEDFIGRLSDWEWPEN